MPIGKARKLIVVGELPQAVLVIQQLLLHLSIDRYVTRHERMHRPIAHIQRKTPYFAFNHTAVFTSMVQIKGRGSTNILLDGFVYCRRVFSKQVMERPMVGLPDRIA